MDEGYVWLFETWDNPCITHRNGEEYEEADISQKLKKEKIFS